jgi:hypothetical protein
MFIRSKEDAVRKALILFKKLSIHEWIPDIYRIGDSRSVLMDRGMRERERPCDSSTDSTDKCIYLLVGGIFL